MLRLDGKVAFVAGAGSVAEGWGNGRATAVLLARQGAKVFGVDISAEALAGTTRAMEAEGLREWTACACNMLATDEVKAAVDQCLTKYGRIDILINNIGGSAPGDPISMSEEVWDSQMDLNLKTAFLGCKHVLPIMERQFEERGAGGAIVNISSIAHITHQFGGRTRVAYATSKAGLEAFGESVAIAFVRKGIRVNSVVVGIVNTPLVEARVVKQLGADPATFLAARNDQVPMGRMGDAWDIAHAVLFLVSDEAKYITAQKIVVDGGVSKARRV
jgi:NAD(P)-dependent dehydrogenase (short-subunit alcohol dehydrogenase family)